MVYFNYTIKQSFNINAKIFCFKELLKMKKSYKIDVDCANCANKMEIAAKATPRDKDPVVNFMTQKLTLAAADDRFPTVLDDVCALIAKMEPDCEVLR